MRLRRALRLLTVTAVTVLAGAVAAPASAAASPAGGDYYQPPTPYDDRGHFDPECSGLNLTVHYRYTGVEAIRNLRGSDGQAFLDDNNRRFREVWTDDATGAVVFTFSGTDHFRETSGYRVPKSSVPADVIPPEGLVGPIYIFRSVDLVRDAVRDADGKALYRDRGSISGRSLFDTLGDSQPGGTQLSFDVLKVTGSVPLLDVDLCDVAAAQLS